MEERIVDRARAQNQVFQHIPRIISPEHNQMLMRPIELM